MELFRSGLEPSWIQTSAVDLRGFEFWLAADLPPVEVLPEAGQGPPQVALPQSTVNAGAWTREDNSGTNLHLSIDETPNPDDADFIRSETLPVNSPVTIGLGTLFTPVSRTDHIVKHRYRKNNASEQTIDLTLDLLQTTTVIQSWSYNNVGTTEVTAEEAVSEANANNITDYGALRLRWTANGTGSAVQPDVTFGLATNAASNAGQSLGLSTSGMTAGQFLLMAMSHRGGSGGTIAYASGGAGGWTLLEQQYNSGTTLATAVFYKFAVAADVNTTITFNTGTAGNVKIAAIMTAWNDVNTTTPIIDVTTVAQVNTASTSTTHPAITVPAQTYMRLAISNIAESGTYSTISGWTHNSNATAASGGGGTGTRNRTHMQHIYTNTVNPGSFTTTNTASAVNVGFHIALARAAAPTWTTRGRVTWAQMQIPEAAPAVTARRRMYVI